MVDKDVEEMVADFAAAAKKHYEATMQGHWVETNKQAKQISKLFRKIRETGDSARQALLAQVDNEDPAIASMAAVYSLKYDTERSLAALQRIAQEPGIIGFQAQQAMMRWEEGEWQLE